jgi:Ca-activated chloride channel homolog
VETRRPTVRAAGLAALVILLAACQASASGEPSGSAEPSGSGSGGPSQPGSQTPRPTGDATLDGPAEVGAGEQFEVSWTGPGATGDYITIVPVGATQWAGEDYFDVSEGSTSTLQASVEDGDYELWYVDGAAPHEILARADIVVTPFEGSVDGPASVGTGDTFEVTWTGPASPGDYITIVEPGVTAWAGQDYFDVSTGNPGQLQAPDAPGNYLLWYVNGLEEAFMVSTEIQVAP